MKSGSIKNYILVWFMLMCSGTVIFNVKYNSVFIPMFVLLAFCNILVEKRKILQINKQKTVFVSVLIMLLLVNTLIHLHDNVQINGVLQIALYIFGTFFVCLSMTKEEYVFAYTDIVFVLCIIAMLLQFLCIYGVVSYEWTDINGRSFPMGYLHTLSWKNGDKYRLSGLYIEPGMFQIIINMAFLFIMEYMRKVKTKKERKKIFLYSIVYLVSMLWTYSTTAYIILGLLLIQYLGKIYRNTQQKWIKTTMFILAPLAIVTILLLLFTSKTVTNKFSQENLSFLYRMNDTISGIIMSLNHPIVGYGCNTNSYYTTTHEFGIYNISSGLINSILCFGFPFVGVILYRVVKNLKNQKWNIGWITMMVVFLLNNLSEACFFFPVIFVFAIGFKNVSIQLRIVPDSISTNI